MNRRVFFLGLLAAMPGLLSAQETKLVNCRTLEAAGNFIGSDEVLVGDRVCRKLKPGETEPSKVETPKPLPGEVISGSESMSVADAAKANAKKTTPAKDSNASEPSADPVHAVAPAENAAPASGQFPAEPAPVQPTPAPPPKKPEIALPVKPPPQQSVAISSPAPETVPAAPVAAVSVAPVASTTAAQPASASATAEPRSAPAPVVRVHRDAPVAPGTPSAPPEKDTGFSDANAVETPPTSAAQAAPVPAAGSAPADEQNSGRRVQVGGFDTPRDEASEASAQPHNTNFRPGDTDGFQEGQRPECTKNITLGSLREERLVLGTPSWAAKWIAKNQKHMADICFSATPMRGAKNYLIVFYTTAREDNGQANVNATMPVPDTGSAGGVGEFTTKYGSTWHYAMDRNVGVTVLTQDDADEPHSQGGVRYATAYAENGMPVAERWPEQPKHAGKGDEKNPKKENAVRAEGEHISEELLGSIVEDLRRM